MWYVFQRNPYFKKNVERFGKFKIRIQTNYEILPPAYEEHLNK